MTGAGVATNPIQTISLGNIRADTSAQPRTSILTDKVSEYVERMTEGDAFPPMVVFFDGKINWLADGFHRYHAAIGIGLKEFQCDVRAGGLRDAILFSCGANAAHGVPRTNEDKRRAVMKLLQDAEWLTWSDRDIARQCNVTHPFVAKLREQIAPADTGNVSSMAERTFTHHKTGAPAKMNTAAIGKKPAPIPSSQPARSVDTMPAVQGNPADATEVAGLANALRIGLCALDPILDRISEIGEFAFWKGIRTAGRQDLVAAMDGLWRLKAVDDAYRSLRLRGVFPDDDRVEDGKAGPRAEVAACANPPMPSRNDAVQAKADRAAAKADFPTEAKAHVALLADKYIKCKP